LQGDLEYGTNSNQLRNFGLADDTAVHSFRSLLGQLATLTKNTVRVPSNPATFDKLALPTALQSRALQLLGLTASL